MYDKEFKGRVTVEDTLQLLYVRYGRGKLDDEIRAIFDESERTEEGNEKFIEYKEYIEKNNKRAMDERKKRKEQMKEYWSKKHGMGAIEHDQSSRQY